MNYSNEPYMVRVDIFKPSGKWYQTIAVNFQGLYEEPLIHNQIEKGLEGYGWNIKSHKGWKVVVLEPYHQHSHPVMIIC
ncbi:MAG: hypothetical protein ACOCP4_02560 [Candidatus Woesearchaeota archaeon]